MLQSQTSGKKTVVSKQWVTVFSVGGRRFAAGMEEVSGIVQWPSVVPVPSQTPFVNAVAWRGKEVLPIFDLARQFHLIIESDPPLCLLAKHEDGIMAVRIDSDMPILQLVDRASIQLSDGADPVVVGKCTIDDQPIDFLCLSKLGKPLA
ncbi:MAG TPA: chemotaxis protein CheW [Nitrospiraceae bacterium]|jgi:chemotaxis signal transduction protein|nr:chemotaxis protein CheW [Nitrospiraceae bacterium]